MNVLKVYGIDGEMMKKLKIIAKQKGCNGVSSLAKWLLNQACLEQNSLQAIAHGTDDEAGKYRLELKLFPDDYQYLQAVAAQQHMSANAVAVQLLRYHITKHPELSDKEEEALYQSNYQLLRIGRNLNQIARQLNSFEAGNITANEIRQLSAIIDKHTEQVSEVLHKHKRRYE
ncbi:plasmid mobilization relaxosome protein MobC [Stenoxybacter acetivorans]|uniref:plasmid mobilization relaxosome protein MobC n=1 Tax=Stenoxybacter acetivorans TaxID=422441 RepID=UPI000568D624|nr:plasmid mobilization relaxosome protein MobC [Stenoxybacter acetivorans]